MTRWLVVANRGAVLRTGMSTVTGQVIDALGSACSATIATDSLDHAGGVLLRVRALLGIWLTTARAGSHCQASYSTLSASWPGIVKNTLVLLPLILSRHRIVLHSHSGGFRAFYLGLPRWKKRVVRWLINRATALIVVHPYYRNHFRFADTKVHAVINGCEDLRAPDRASSPEVRLLYLGNLIREKGLPELLSAYAKLRAGDAEVRLTVAGAPADMGPADLGNEIDYRGVVIATDEKARLITESDLLVLPTRYRNEALPLVALEALSAGTPVLCTPFRVLQQIVTPGHNGWHCEADADSIAAAVRNFQALSDTEKAAIRANCRDDWESNYTIGRFQQQVRELLASLTA